MVELSKQLLSWIARLRPTQKVKGDHAIQTGTVHGRLHVDRSTHHHTQHNNHITIVQAASIPPVRPNHPAPPIAPRLVENSPAPLASSAACAAALKKLDQLRDRSRVLDFMEREFGTRMVIHLTSEQLYRLDRYLDVVLKDRRNLKTTRRRQ